MKNRHLSSLDLDTLKSMYEAKVAELVARLQNKVPWEETIELRNSLSELSAAIYDKINNSKFPGDKP